MSLIFLNGFDDGLNALGKYDLWGGPPLLDASGGRFGGSCLRMTGFNAMVARRVVNVADEHATFTAGFAFKGNHANSFQADGGTGNNTGHFSLMSDNGTTVHLTLVFRGGTGVSPTVEVRRGTQAGTLLGTAVAVPGWILDQWYYGEIQASLHDTTGTVIVKINGVTYINLTGQDTKNGGTKTVFDSCQLNHNWITNSGVDMRYDDFYLTNGAGSVNTGFLGDVSVETLYPSGNGSSSQFTGSDGNSTDNYLLVDEAGTPSTVDYVQDATVGQKDLYAYSNLVTATGTVYGVQVAAYAQASASGAASVKNIIKSGATTAASAALPLVTTYLPKLSIQETDPDTAAAWTIAGVNAAEVGVEVA